MGVTFSFLNQAQTKPAFNPQIVGTSAVAADAGGTEQLKHILEQAGVDVSKVPKQLLQSPELLDSLAAKKLLLPTESNTTRNAQIQEVVTQMSAQLRLGNEANSTIDLTNLSEFKKVAETLLERLNQSATEPGFKGITGPSQEKLKSVFADPELTNKEKLTKASGIIEEMVGFVKSEKKTVSSELQMLQGVGRYAASAQLTEKLSADTKNAFNEMSGILVDTKTRDADIAGITKRVKSSDPELGEKLAEGFSKITNDATLSLKEQSKAAAKLLRNAAEGKRVEPFTDMLKTAVKLENDVSRHQFTDQQKTELRDINAEISKLIEGDDPDAVRTLRDLKVLAVVVGHTPYMSNKAKNEELADILEDITEQPELKKAENKEVKAKIEKFALSLGETPKQAAPKPTELKLNNNNKVSYTPQGPGNRAELDANASLNIAGAGGKVGVAMKGSHLQRLELGANIPVQPGVTVGGEVKYSASAEAKEDKIVQQTTWQGGPKVGVGIGEQAINVGLKGNYSVEKTFENKMHVLENIPIDSAAVKAAYSVDGSKLTRPTVDALKHDAEQLNAVRDGAEKLSAQLKSAGIVEQDLKVPQGYSAAVAMDTTSAKGALDVGLKAGGILSLGVSIETGYKAETKVGDRIAAMQDFPELMDKTLQRYKMDDVKDLLDKSEEVGDSDAGSILEREKLKTRVKNMISDNLNEAQRYQSALRQTTSHSKEDRLVQTAGDPEQKRMMAQLEKLAKQEKSSVEKENHTGSVSRTLDKMLIKHAALTQAYKNLTEQTDGEPKLAQPTHTLSTRFKSFDEAQKLRTDALDLAIPKRVELKAAKDAQFSTLLEEANEQLQEPNATLKLNTLRQLQRVTPESSEKYFKIDVKFPGASVQAEIASKPAMKAGEEHELTATLRTNNALSKVIERIVDKVQNNGKVQEEEATSDAVKKDNKETAGSIADGIKSDWKGGTTKLEVGFKGGKFDHAIASTEATVTLGFTRLSPRLHGEANLEFRKQLKDDGTSEVVRSSNVKLDIGLDLSKGKLAEKLADKFTRREGQTPPEQLIKDLKSTANNSHLEVNYDAGKFKSSKLESKLNLAAGPVKTQASMAIEYKSVAKEGGADGETEIKRDTTYKLNVDSKLTDGMIEQIGDKFFGGNMPDGVKANLKAAKNGSAVETKYEDDQFKSSSVSTNTTLQIGGTTAKVGITRTVKAEKDDNGDIQNKPETVIKINANQKLSQKSLDKLAEKLEKDFGIDLDSKLTIPPKMENTDLADLEVKIADGKTEVKGTVLGKKINKP